MNHFVRPIRSAPGALTTSTAARQVPDQFATLWTDRSASARAKRNLPIICRFFVSAAALILVACANMPETASSIATAPRYEDFADDWLAFHDATEGLPMEQRKVAFDRDVAAKFPGFFRDRYKTAEDKAAFDARLVGSIDAFGSVREAFVAKHDAFAGALRQNVSLFAEVFPDFKNAMPIAVVHSLGEMDGGTRTLGDRQWLVFGIDAMVQYHAPESDERAFFAHELFHVYHGDHLGACDAVWCSLWSEGLAVHVAATLNPNATEQDLLLNIPAEMSPGVRAAPGAVARDLLRVFDSEDPADYSPRFTSRKDASGLPPRRGYYLGYLVAQKIGVSRTLHELATLDAATARPLVRATLEEMARD